MGHENYAGHGEVKVAWALPGLVSRDDLVARLDHAATRKVTIVSAPAGSGKTSLLRAWAAARTGLTASRRCRCAMTSRMRSFSGSPCSTPSVGLPAATGMSRHCDAQNLTGRRWSTRSCRSSPNIVAASCW